MPQNACVALTPIIDLDFKTKAESYAYGMPKILRLGLHLRSLSCDLDGQQ